MGEVYRELERQGKIPPENIEKKAEYLANKAAKEEALSQQSSVWAKIKAMIAKLNLRLFDQ